jgi:thiol:disulfide interchange protein
MRQQLRLRVLVPVAVLGLLGAGFGAFAMGGPEAPESIPVPRATSSAAIDTGAADTGVTDTAPIPTTTEAAPAPPPPTTTEAAPPAEPADEKTALEKKLKQSRVVVVVFHTPGSDVDAAAVREARAGAAAADVGFLAVDVTKEKQVAALAAEYEVVEAPTVLVVVRSGEAVSRFDNIVDRKTVAQAATNAKK